MIPGKISAVVLVLAMFTGMLGQAHGIGDILGTWTDRTPPDDVIKSEMNFEWVYLELPVYGIVSEKNVVAANHGNKIRFYNAANGAFTGEIATYGGSIYGMDMNLGKDIIAYGGQMSNISIAKVSTKEVIYVMLQNALPDQVDDIAISTDGNYLAVGVVQNAAQELFVYNIATPYSPQELFKKNLGWIDALSVDFASDNKVLVGTSVNITASGDEFMAFDLSGNLYRHKDFGTTMSASVTDLCSNPVDKNEVVVATRYDATEAKLVNVSYGIPQVMASYDIPGSVQAMRCAVSPDGNKIAYSSNIGYFYAYNKTTGSLLKNFTHEIGTSVAGLSWGIEGDRIFTGDTRTNTQAMLKSWRDVIKPTVKQMSTFPTTYVSTTFDVTIEFSEEMNSGSSTLEVTYGPVPPYRNYSVSGVWLDRKDWQGSTTVPQGLSEGPNKINVSKGQDRAGNVMLSNTNKDIFIDTVPPTVALSQMQYWVDASQAQIGFTINDGPLQRSSGIEWLSFFYRKSTDNSSWSAWTNFSYLHTPPLSGIQSFNFPGDGNYQLCAVATDRAGNANPIGNIMLGHDVTLPSASISSFPFYHDNRTVTITYSASDDLNMTKLNITERSSLDNATWSAEKEIFNTTNAFGGSIGQTVASDGFYKFTTYARDERGNVRAVNTTLAVDTNAPLVSLDRQGKYWVAGRFNVTYSASDPISLANVTLFVRNGTDNSTWSSWGAFFTKSAPPFTGNASFTPTSDGFYQMWMMAKDRSGNANALVPQVFFGYDTKPPGVSVKTPYYWFKGDLTMTPSVTDNLWLRSLEVSYRYSKDNVSFGGWTPYNSTNISGKSWSGDIKFMPLQEGYYIIKLDVFDLSGRNASTTVKAGYDVTPPSSKLETLPKYTTSKAFPIKLASEDDQLSGIEQVALWYKKDSSAATFYGNFSGKDMTFDTGATGGDGNYSFWSIARDNAGNAEQKGASETWTIVDTKPPSAMLIFPNANSTDVPVSARVTVQFTETVSRGLTFTLESGGKPVMGTMSWESGDTKIIFTPLTILELSSTYWANVSGGSDIAGNQFQTCSWWFKTTNVPLKGSISGVVRDRTGNVQSGARVEAWANGSLVKASMSNASGSYSIKDLEVGTYELHASMSGYVTYKTTAAITLSRLDVVIDIALDPDLGTKAPYDPLTTMIGGVLPLWLLILLIVILLVALLFVAARRRHRAGSGMEAERTAKEEEPPKVVVPPVAGPAHQEHKDVEAEEPPPSEREPEPVVGEFACPLCGSMIKPEERRCSGCKALVAR